MLLPPTEPLDGNRGISIFDALIQSVNTKKKRPEIASFQASSKSTFSSSRIDYFLRVLGSKLGLNQAITKSSSSSPVTLTILFFKRPSSIKPTFLYNPIAGPLDARTKSSTRITSGISLRTVSVKLTHSAVPTPFPCILE